ncbi:hypothetical protein C4D60_Mb05t13640 [Musa balbisiana]|uniref:Uncharacterized protein n=1 Tax=Musa balbisiana TaxID=52838 RepID=A0A4S8JVY2_MUSBA|nr:hypothetical protein C4D60_Mb05t13640 [Musa balbisiana]
MASPRHDQTHQGALIPVAGKSIRSSRNLHGVFVEAKLTGRRRRSCRALLHASASNLHVGRLGKSLRRCAKANKFFLGPPQWEEESVPSVLCAWKCPEDNSSSAMPLICSRKTPSHRCLHRLWTQ